MNENYKKLLEEMKENLKQFQNYKEDILNCYFYHYPTDLVKITLENGEIVEVTRDEALRMKIRSFYNLVETYVFHAITDFAVAPSRMFRKAIEYADQAKALVDYHIIQEIIRDYFEPDEVDKYNFFGK